jgi:hypothetical protein
LRAGRIVHCGSLADLAASLGTVRPGRCWPNGPRSRGTLAP